MDNKSPEFIPLKRSYTITCLKDEWNINNGRCPDYAITWGNYNRLFWNKNHDYINGYKDSEPRNKKK